MDSEPGEFIARPHDVMSEYYDLCELADTIDEAAVKRQLREFMQRDRDFLDSYTYLAELLREEGDFTEEKLLRVEAYERALEQITDDDGQWPDVLSWLYLDNRHIIRAIFNRAVLHWREDESESAANLLRKLLHSNPPDNIGARYYLLAIIAGMKYDEFMLRFERDDQSSNVLDGWFDSNSGKFPDEFAWWARAVEPLTQCHFDKLAEDRDETQHDNEVDMKQTRPRGRGVRRAEPVVETYRAADGRQVQFLITARKFPSGFLVEAEETPDSRGTRFGYRFRAFSAIKPWCALGALRDKIRRNLAVNYLDTSEPVALPTHSELVGRIDYSSEDKEVVLEIDGRKVTKDDFWKIISIHEGFEIELKIRSE
jgi:tetratricopeptide (TPR) repeat protein